MPGKNSPSYLWKLTVITLSVVRKASSTPSPWWMSMSTYSTLQAVKAGESQLTKSAALQVAQMGGT